MNLINVAWTKEVEARSRHNGDKKEWAAEIRELKTRRGARARVTGRRRRRRRCTILITVRSEQFLNVILLHRPAKNRCTPVDYYYYAARLCRNLVGVIFPFSSPFFPSPFFFPFSFFHQHETHSECGITMTPPRCVHPRVSSTPISRYRVYHSLELN